MHSTKYEKLDYSSIRVFELIQVFPRWPTNKLAGGNKRKSAELWALVRLMPRAIILESNRSERIY